jgi:parvulin-like peptidyl-prolyl isomerase
MLRVDKIEMYGTMILDIVGSRMQGTRGRDSARTATVGRRWHWLALLLLALALAACNGGEDRGQPATPQDQPTVIVLATSEPQQGSPAAAPTTAVPTVTPTVTPPAPLAALVNGEYVFLAEYEQRVTQYEQALLQQGLDPDTPDGKAHLALARQDVLEGLIDGVLVEQGAGALGVSLSDEELESQVEADIAAGGGQAAFDEWLQTTGQTREEYKGMLRQSLLSQRVLEAVTADVPAEAEQVHARHIVVESEEAAEEILMLLQAGGDFVALARERSVDVATQDNGGDLGWFPRGLIALELETAAFALQPGQVSGVVHLGEGYHIVQVVEREAARSLTPEMQFDLKLAVFDQWLADLRAAATIERFVGE